MESLAKLEALRKELSKLEKDEKALTPDQIRKLLAEINSCLKEVVDGLPQEE